jgi:hypothetical protein
MKIKTKVLLLRLVPVFEILLTAYGFFGPDAKVASKRESLIPWL